ncbi:MAG: hypothetical protein J6D09_02455 [Clostridia bacterium]|nr:hypothetical protein [Clostridia bacterium]
MIFKPKKTPYQGLWAFILFMLLPSVVMTSLSFGAMMKWQGRFGADFNWASAKAVGCGLGILFHISCIIIGAFTEDFNAVKTRLKEFIANLSASPKTAFKWYWQDVKTLGLAFYIDLALVGINIYVFVDALQDYFALNGVI